MKVIFMGTPDFSVGTLEALIEAGHEITMVVTQPDKPKGRGKSMQFSAVKEAALEHNLPVYQPLKIREPECIEYLNTIEADIIVVVAFGQILPKEILEMPSLGCVNVHASLLPKYRGAAPIQWAVIDGEKETGVTTMQMDVGLDTGDMIMKTVVALEEEETGGSLFDKLSTEGAKLCVKTLEALENKTATFEKQKDEDSTYAKMIDKQMGKINWSESSVVIERLIRGLNPWPSAFTSLNGKTLKIWKAKVVEGRQGEPGEVIEVTKDSLVVATGDGALAITELQLEGKKRMETDAFLRGMTIEKGIKLQ